jgi:hypothetical protein
MLLAERSEFANCGPVNDDSNTALESTEFQPLLEFNLVGRTRGWQMAALTSGLYYRSILERPPDYDCRQEPDRLFCVCKCPPFDPCDDQGRHRNSS